MRGWWVGVLLCLSLMAQAGGQMPNIGAGSTLKVRTNPDGSVDMDRVMAQMRLQQGRYRMAAEQARACLEKKPESGPCEAILAQALSNIGMCDKALERFASLRPRKAWTQETAIAEGQCHLRKGSTSAAIAAFEEAVWLAPAAANPKYQLAMAYIRVGDWGAAADEMARLDEARNGMSMPGLARAIWALETGNDQFEAEIAELLADPELTNSAQVQVHLLLGRKWMDVGDPWAAGPEIKEGVMFSLSNVRAVSYRAEAVRRQGDPESALEMLDRQWFLDAESPIRDAIKARVLVDLGELDEASGLLEGLGDPDYSEALASRWYLAQARGDVALGDQIARVWRSSVPNAERQLSQLAPPEDD